MGYGAAIVLVLVMVAAMYYAYSQNKPPKMDREDLSPNTFESFKTNTNQEGAVWPWFAGYARFSANILYYGNLTTTEITEQYEVPDGGKGGGGGTKKKTQVVGHKYYMDLWYGICQGPGVTMLDHWNNGKVQGELWGEYNAGDGSTYPSYSGPSYPSKCNPLVHAWSEQEWIGDNVSSIPNYHFEMKRDLDNVIGGTCGTNGVNPAALIYEILLEGGATETTDFVNSSFEDARDYWASKDLELCYMVTSQVGIRAAVKSVLGYAPGVLYMDEDDKYYLRAYKETDTAEFTFTQDDFEEFIFQRQTWDDCHSFFVGNYTDKSMEYTTRTVQDRNGATEQVLGYEKKFTVDLSMIVDRDLAHQRLAEVMKEMSYPKSYIECKVGIKFEQLKPGMVIEISHSDYGIVSASFRVTEVGNRETKDNFVTFQAEQNIYALFDDEYVVAGISQWTNPDYSAQTAQQQDYFELPYTSDYKTSPAYLTLCQRKGVETDYAIMVSVDGGTNYSMSQVSSTWAMHGTLDEAYVGWDTTGPIDDDTGILFTPSYAEDPVYYTNTRKSLFLDNRFAIIGAGATLATREIVAFQEIEYVGASSIRLKGVIRGLFETRCDSTWSSGTKIWITRFGTNIVSGISSSSFHLKYLPAWQGETIETGDATAISASYSGNALKVHPIHFIKATRSGSTVTIQCWPVARSGLGAGKGAEDQYADQWPPDFEGKLEYYTSLNATHYIVDVADIVISTASAFTFYVSSVIDGQNQTERDGSATYSQIYVDTADGDYYGPSNMHVQSNTGLYYIPYNALGWNEVMGYNAEIYDDLLRISGLLDSNIGTSPSNKDVPYWDADNETLELGVWDDFFTTTTTTT